MSELAPDDVEKVTADIRAVAESRGDDSEVVDLVELAKPEDDQLSADELRDAWPLLDLDERADGLRVLPREDAEDFFVALAPSAQAALLVHFRSGQRRQWIRLLEPDDVVDVVQEAGEAHREALLGLLE